MLMCDSCKKINKCWGKNYCEKYEHKTEQTNEEWRKTCSTEEYAVWLWKHFDHGEVIVLWEKYGCPMYKDDNGVSRADYTEAMKKWLREKRE